MKEFSHKSGFLKSCDTWIEYPLWSSLNWPQIIPPGGPTEKMFNC